MSDLYGWLEGFENPDLEGKETSADKGPAEEGGILTDTDRPDSLATIEPLFDKRIVRAVRERSEEHTSELQSPN